MQPQLWLLQQASRRQPPSGNAGRRSLRLSETVANSVNRYDVMLLSISLHLAPQIGNVNVDGAIKPFEIGAESTGHQFVTGERASRGLRQRLQEPELRRRKSDLPSAQPRTPAPAIDFQLTYGNGRRWSGRLRRGSPQQRLHPRD